MYAKCLMAFQVFLFFEPLACYPRLLHGTPAERNSYEILGAGEVIRWPDLDEDLSAESILAGRRSGESEQSLPPSLHRKTKQPLQPSYGGKGWFDKLIEFCRG
jgi:hypothetical protein